MSGALAQDRPPAAKEAGVIVAAAALVAALAGVSDVLALAVVEGVAGAVDDVREADGGQPVFREVDPRLDWARRAWSWMDEARRRAALAELRAVEHAAFADYRRRTDAAPDATPSRVAAAPDRAPDRAPRSDAARPSPPRARPSATVENRRAAMRRAASRSAGAAADLAEAGADEWAERAAILEFEQGMSRADAEAAATRLLGWAPAERDGARGHG